MRKLARLRLRVGGAGDEDAWAQLAEDVYEELGAGASAFILLDMTRNGSPAVYASSSILDLFGTCPKLAAEKAGLNVDAILLHRLSDELPIATSRKKERNLEISSRLMVCAAGCESEDILGRPWVGFLSTVPLQRFRC